MYRADGGLALKNGVLEGVLVLFRDHIAPFMSEKRVNTIQCVEDSNNFLTFWLSHCQLKANRDSLQVNKSSQNLRIKYLNIVFLKELKL